MKRHILHLADLHLSAEARQGGQLVLTRDGSSRDLQDRIDAVVACHNEASRMIEERTGHQCGPDGIVVTGDVYDVPNPSEASRDAALRLFEHLANRCDAGRVLVFDGNHDIPRNPRAPGATYTMSYVTEIVSVAQPAVVAYAGMRFGVLPYPRRSAYREMVLQRGADPTDLSQEVIENALGLAAASLHAEAVEKAREGQPLALLYHGNFAGARVSLQPRAIDLDLQLPLPAASLWPAVLAGHIHLRQRLNGHQAAAYAGSPTISDFGEVGQRKGGLLWTFEDGSNEPPTIEEVTVEGRPWLTIEADQGTVAEVERRLDGTHVDAVCRVRGAVSSADLAALRDAIARARTRGLVVQDNLTLARTERDGAAPERDTAAARTDDALFRDALTSRALEASIADRVATLFADVRDRARRDS